MNRADLEKKKKRMELIAAFALAASIFTAGGMAFCYSHFQTSNGYLEKMKNGDVFFRDSVSKDFTARCRAEMNKTSPDQAVEDCARQATDQFIIQGIIDMEQSVNRNSRYGIVFGLITMLNLSLLRASWKERQAAKTELAKPEI